MGCLKLSYQETDDRQNLLSVWKGTAYEKSDYDNFLPFSEKKAGKESCIDYYPFGLTFNSYQRENSTQNKYLYNQGEGEKKFLTERVFDLGLNIDLSKDRTYDYITGRWWQVDPKADEDELVYLTPYNYSLNNPIRYNDPKGDCPICITAGAGALIGAIAGAGIAAYEGKSLGDIGKAAVVGAVGGAIIGSGAGLLATSTVAATGLMSATAGAVATNAAVGMVSGAAEETTKQVLDGKGMNTATIVKASAAGGAVNAVAGPLGKLLGPAIKSLTNTVTKTLTQAGVKATTQTTANTALKTGAAIVKDVAKETTQKAAENKVQDKLQKQ